MKYVEKLELFDFIDVVLYEKYGGNGDVIVTRNTPNREYIPIYEGHDNFSCAFIYRESKKSKDSKNGSVARQILPNRKYFYELDDNVSSYTEDDTIVDFRIMWDLLYFIKLIHQNSLIQ